MAPISQQAYRERFPDLFRKLSGNAAQDVDRAALQPPGADTSPTAFVLAKRSSKAQRRYDAAAELVPYLMGGINPNSQPSNSALSFDSR